MSVAVLAAAMVGCASASPRVPSRPSVSSLETVAPTGAQEGIAIGVSASANAHGPNSGVISNNKVETSGALMLESSSAALAEALAGNSDRPTAESEVRLAQAYMRHRVLDKASEHFTAASRLDPREGAAWDGLARVWRDWGFPQIGLGDAYRAVSASPDSPAVRNTLGTILQTLGYGSAARVHFARASALDHRAVYALNNLCYSWLVEANAEAATVECTRALEVDPNLTAARWNLSLARTLAAHRTEKGPEP